MQSDENDAIIHNKAKRFKNMDRCKRRYKNAQRCTCKLRATHCAAKYKHALQRRAKRSSVTGRKTTRNKANQRKFLQEDAESCKTKQRYAKHNAAKSSCILPKPLRVTSFSYPPSHTKHVTCDTVPFTFRTPERVYNTCGTFTQNAREHDLCKANLHASEGA